jgi:hypothetical protein
MGQNLQYFPYIVNFDFTFCTFVFNGFDTIIYAL